MAIYNDCKIVIDLNKLVRTRPCGVELDDQHVDNIANDLRRRMTFDTLFSQVDQAIWDYAEECNIDLSDSEECQSFGFQIPQYGSTAGDEPAKSFEEARKKFKKEFDMVKLESPSWTIEVPLRKKNTLSKH